MKYIVTAITPLGTFKSGKISSESAERFKNAIGRKDLESFYFTYSNGSQIHLARDVVNNSVFKFSRTWF